MSASFGSRAPSKFATDKLRSVRRDRPTMRATPLPSDAPALPSAPIRLDAQITHHWPVRDQFGRGTCVAFATLAAIELVHARRDDMPPERLSEQFLHDTMLEKHPLGADVAAEVPEGGVLLHQAWHAVQADGVVGADHVPYKPARFDDPPAAENGADIAAIAAANRIMPHAYGTMGTPENMDVSQYDVITPAAGTDRRILGFLQDGLPVAIGVPLFSHPSGLNNWTLPAAMQSGFVHCPEDAGAPVLEGPRDDGHVVCITGFIPDPAEPLGGWFIFRNSWGLEFGSHATSPLGQRSTDTRGYGLLSATHINAYCWEYLVPAA